MHPSEFWWMYEAKMPPEKRADRMEPVYKAYMQALNRQKKG